MKLITVTGTFKGSEDILYYINPDQIVSITECDYFYRQDAPKANTTISTGGENYHIIESIDEIFQKIGIPKPS